MKKQLLVLFLPLVMAFNANALFELRAGYGVNTPKDDNVSGNTLSTMTGFNLDAIVELPMVPVGLGLRYESMGMDVGVGPTTVSSDMTRMSLLINYRIIDFFTYLGIIGTIGFDNEVVLNTSPISFTYEADMTYSIGVEGGVSLGMMMIGAELGYNIAEYENSVAIPSTVPFDGIYAKAIVGVGF